MAVQDKDENGTSATAKYTPTVTAANFEQRLRIMASKQKHQPLRRCGSSVESRRRPTSEIRGE